jgi:hypothetical protein
MEMLYELCGCFDVVAVWSAGTVTSVSFSEVWHDPVKTWVVHVTLSRYGGTPLAA